MRTKEEVLREKEVMIGLPIPYKDRIHEAMQDYAIEHNDFQITERANAIARVIECKEKIEKLEDDKVELISALLTLKNIILLGYDSEFNSPELNELLTKHEQI